MRNRTLAPLHRLLIAWILLLAVPAAPVLAQDEEEEEEGEESGELDTLMATDPERSEEKAEEDEGEGEAEEEDGPKEQSGDEERPPGEPEPEADEDQAEEPAEPADNQTRGFQLALLVGYGASLSDGPNIWNPGFGAQAGYDIGLFVFGGRFVYYLGGSDEAMTLDAFQNVTTVEVSANVWEFSFEAAADLQLSDTVALRPGLGLGFAGVGGDSQESKLYAAISPGAALLISPSGGFFFGLDARFQVIPADPEAVNGLIFLAALGMRL